MEMAFERSWEANLDLYVTHLSLVELLVAPALVGAVLAGTLPGFADLQLPAR
jgi:hypothetical protein